jgi:hypothetical protein
MVTQKWSVFGQSFGGFCVLTYLSFFPQGLREAFTSGGLPPIGRTPDQVYKATYQKVIERNKAYYSVSSNFCCILSMSYMFVAFC